MSNNTSDAGRQALRENLAGWAAEVGAHRYTNRFAKDEPAHAFSIDQLEALYHRVAAHLLEATGSWVVNDAIMENVRAEAARAALAAQPAADVLEQALTDPENQPSQWGTVPLAQYEALQAERAEDDALRMKMADLLTRTANAIRGEPGPCRRWGWEDLPERAQAAMAALGVTANLAASKPAQPVAPAIPPGWKLVPIEPTPEMMQAPHTMRGPGYEGVWRAMLAAAPVSGAQDAPPAPPCPDCNGTGSRDSGGIHPWGEPIFVPCDCGAQDARG